MERRLTAVTEMAPGPTNQHILNAIAEQSKLLSKLLELQSQILVDQKKLIEENTALRQENDSLKSRMDRLESLVDSQSAAVSSASPSHQFSQPAPAPPLPPVIGSAPSSFLGQRIPLVPRLPPPFPPFRQFGSAPVDMPRSGLVSGHRPVVYRSPPPAPMPSFPSLISRILREQSERERSACNAVIVGMDDTDQCTGISTAEAPNADYKCVAKCLEDLGIGMDNLLSVTRLGSKQYARMGKRILMVVFADSTTKAQFITGFPKLSTEACRHAAYVREDLTPLQRHEKALQADSVPKQASVGPRNLAPVNF